MKILAFSDIHGNVDAIRILVTQTYKEKFDAIIIAGDFTNLVLDIDFDEAQKQFDKMFKLLSALNAPIYYVFGNRDYAMKASIQPKYPIYLGITGKRFKLGKHYITGNPSKVNKKTIFVSHDTDVDAKDALLHIVGHTHKRFYTGNLLNLGYVYKDAVHGAMPKLGGYCIIDLDTEMLIGWRNLEIG